MRARDDSSLSGARTLCEEVELGLLVLLLEGRAGIVVVLSVVIHAAFEPFAQNVQDVTVHQPEGKLTLLKIPN